MNKTENTMLRNFVLLSLLFAVAGTTYANDVVRDEVVFFQTDALGSAVAAVDESGDECWTEQYTPYGDKTVANDANPRVGCGIIGTERGYTGHADDVETGLVYMQQRYYDPSSGRFLSVDPEPVDPSDHRTFNRYSYAANNPYKYSDPTGEAFDIAWDAFNVALGAASFSSNISAGNYGWAAVDSLGIAVDGIAAIVPFVPGGFGASIKATRGLGKATESGQFADIKKLNGHFRDHGAEFGAKNAEEYLSIAHEVMKNGTKVNYKYKDEIRTGFVQFMGNNKKGQSKFGFVGTNSQGNITTFHTKSGKDFWKSLNGNASDKTIRPAQ